MRFPITFTALVMLNSVAGIMPVTAEVPARMDSVAPKARQPRPRTTVEIQNNRNVDVTVYAQTGTEDVRLGVVHPDSIATLYLPDWLVTESRSVDIFVQPKGQFEEDTGQLELREGEHIGVIVPRSPRLQWLMPEQ